MHSLQSKLEKVTFICKGCGEHMCPRACVRVYKWDGRRVGGGGPQSKDLNLTKQDSMAWMVMMQDAFFNNDKTDRQRVSKCLV